MRLIIACSMFLFALLVLLAAGAPARNPQTEAPPPAAQKTVPPTSGAESPGGIEESASASNYLIPWLTLNSGGDHQGSSPGYGLAYSVGQTSTGSGSSSNYRMGIGFWYGVTGLGAGGCPIVATGDVNIDGPINAADVIYMVNYVFKAGPVPLPCAASADVNCDGTVNAADVIYHVNYVFKAGALPCDACVLIPGTWTCP